jgi:hypothetical protein
MARRLKKTLLDYLVIAISPALITLMVGSLVLFLIQVFYQGNFQGRLQYIFALFVMAAVLIARISIESGRERAVIFAIPLGIVTMLAINKFVQFQGGMLQSLTFFINLGLIAIVWWSSDKLTWDCTLIDEDQEDSGEGLLEAVGLDRSDKAALEQEIAPLPESEAGLGRELNSRPRSGSKEAAVQLPPQQIEATTSRDEPSWWQRFIDRRRRPHATGVWVIYFSLAALPLFGIGQLFIPAGDLAARQNAFILLCIYTSSGLGLLMATSFLGLRRYLRQRRQEMPLSTVNLWLMIGGLMIAGVMLAAMLLPRPNAEYAISEPPFRIGSPDQQQSSQYGAGNDAVDENQPSGQSEDRENQQSGSTSSQRDGKTTSDKGDNVAGTRRVPSPSDEKADKAQSDKTDKQSSDRAASEKPPKKPPKASGNSAAGKQSPDNARGQNQKNSQSSEKAPPTPILPRITFSPADSLMALFKWIFYGALFLLVIYVVWRSRYELLAALSNFGQWLIDFWHNLFAGTLGGADEEGNEERPKRRTRRPFADFADPFASGMADRYSPAELVRYTFEAVEAWAWEHGQPREADQTPHEFARRLASKFSTLGEDAGRLADLYAQAAYAPVTLPAANVARLSHLWQNLRTLGTVPISTQ